MDAPVGQKRRYGRWGGQMQVIAPVRVQAQPALTAGLLLAGRAPASSDPHWRWPLPSRQKRTFHRSDRVRYFRRAWRRVFPEERC